MVSDHACCQAETKFGDPADDVFLAKSGFGGTEYLLAGMISEGRERGLSYGRIAAVDREEPGAALRPNSKGDIEVGLDADIALVDTDRTWTVRAEDSESTQEYTPFEGFELTAKVTDTFLRGEQIMTDGVVTSAAPTGKFLSRPTA